MSTPHSPQAGIADALRQLSDETRVLVRQEIDAARDEVWQKAKHLLPAGGMLGLAGLLGIFATASLFRFVLRLVEKVFPPALASMVASSVFGASAFYCAKIGVERVRESALPVPSGTIGQVAQEVRDVSLSADS